MKTPYPLTRHELQQQCPLVTVRVEDDGLAGIRDGERVIHIRGTINKRTMGAFIDAYHFAVSRGLIRPKEKE